MFLQLGQYSWDRIMHDGWRRRVGLQFMFSLLKIEPLVYKVNLNYVAEMMELDNI